MSVQKFIVNKSTSNYTTIPNKVIRGLKDNLELLGFYLYLLSLPPNWEFHKTELRKTCGLGINKVDRFINMLVQHGLVSVVQNRNAQGHFAHFDLTVLDGQDFKINKLDKQCAPFYENRANGNGGTGLVSYKRNIDKYKASLLNKEKENISCASNDAQTSYFDDFWKTYPVKKNKIRAKKNWDKQIKTPEEAKKIIADVNNRMNLDHQWRNKQFIPHPSTYLSEKRWEDEIIKAENSENKNVDFKRRSGELRSTVQWFNDNH